MSGAVSDRETLRSHEFWCAVLWLKLYSHWHQYESKSGFLCMAWQGSLYIVNSVKLHYLHHNNDIIVDVKTLWLSFLLFSWQKQRNTQKLRVF